MLVTGTDTGVGKTIVDRGDRGRGAGRGAAGRGGQAGARPVRPPASRPTSTSVTRLAAPLTASAPWPVPGSAGAAGRGPGRRAAAAGAVRRWSTRSAREADKHDLVLVEGAGGLLVPMGLRPSGEPWTVADLAVSLGAPAVVVARAGLGTLNHTALTLEALDRRAVPGRGGDRCLAGGAGAGALGEPRPSWCRTCSAALPERRRRDGPGGVPAVRPGLAHPGPVRGARRLADLGRGSRLTTVPGERGRSRTTTSASGIRKVRLSGH